MKSFIQSALIVAAVIVVLIVAVVWKVNDVMTNGEFFERHIVKGEPTLQINIEGFLDADFKAFIDTGRRKKKIFDSLECYSPDFLETTNTIGRKFQGTTVQREMDKGSAPLFTVLWSDDGQRVGIAFRGYFVAAYDRVTGKKIQFSDYLKDMGVKDRNGGELWHDYKQCDADIEQFLQPKN